MRDLLDKSILVYDHGAFLSFARRMAGENGFGKVYYFSPWEDVFASMEDWAVGQGFDEIIRVDEPTDVIDDVDVIAFPDVHHGGLQGWLEGKGYAVWGSRRMDQLEIAKLRFKKIQEALGMNVGTYAVVTGVDALREYCKRHRKKWVKLVRQFRWDMDTWFHDNYDESRHTLDGLAEHYGGMQDHIGFILEDPIESEDKDEPVLESGMDTIVVDGKHPDQAVLGYEIKDACYLATVKPYDEFPEEVRECTDPLLPLLKDGHYRNWFSTEVRIKKGKPFLLEPTTRQASPAGEEQLKLYTNLPRMVYEGAHGRMVGAEIAKKFACEATITHKDDEEGWRTMRVPSEIDEWVMLYSCAKDGELYHIKPMVSVVGAVVGLGDTPKEAIEHLQANAEKLKSKKVTVNTDAIAEAIQEINKAEDQGIEFSDKALPEPEEVLNAD